MAALVAGAAPLGAQSGTGGSGPALEPIETWTTDLGPNLGMALIFRNNRHHPVRIVSIELLQCVNTSPSCRKVDPRIVLDANQTREVFTVRPMNRGEPMAFTYRYVWEPLSNVVPVAEAAAVVAAAASTGDLTFTAARALGARFHRIRLEPDSFVLRLGDTLDLDSLRVYAVDSAGTTLGRVRLYETRVQPGAVLQIGQFQVLALSNGAAPMMIRVMPQGWAGDPARPRPEASLRLIVRPRPR